MSEHTEFYAGINKAYNHFNTVLFDGQLPQVIITLASSNKFAGYHYAEHFVNRQSDRIDEICLNPDLFLHRPDEVILSTLVHEMVHCWQQHFGKPTRNGYHNKQWANKMLDIGLEPFSITNPSKMTGQKVSHNVSPAGKYQKAYEAKRKEFSFIGFRATIQQKTTKTVKKVKAVYECDECGMKVWGKPGLNVVCGSCDLTCKCTVPESDE